MPRNEKVRRAMNLVKRRTAAHRSVYSLLYLLKDLRTIREKTFVVANDIKHTFVIEKLNE